MIVNFITKRCLYYVTIPAGQTVTVSVADYTMDCPFDLLQILIGTTININLCSTTQRQFSFSGGTAGRCFININFWTTRTFQGHHLHFCRNNYFICFLQWKVCNRKRIPGFDLSELFNIPTSYNSCSNYNKNPHNNNYNCFR